MSILSCFFSLTDYCRYMNICSDRLQIKATLSTPALHSLLLKSTPLVASHPR
ncbi:MAG: hypothetical protein RMX96_19005 [Nostoc sp. ChiSLP02]|nr:hypothetical protein [Nostoc sp. DedSLP05]MDZ8102694.1 hypothetical protein [Nostoc sp. DedSLP01]MDZ8186925.1 hypothetical protein [Nostoc sp. ChiSLP02]